MKLVKASPPLVINDKTIPKEGIVYSLAGTSLKGPVIIQDEFEGEGLWEFQLCLDPNRTIRVHAQDCELVRHNLRWKNIFLPNVILESDHQGPIAQLIPTSNDDVLVMNENSWMLPEVTLLNF